MKAIISKWGDGLALKIPAECTERMMIHEGMEVRLSISEGRMIVDLPREEVTLESLMDAITPENCHGEIDWGKPAGGEI